MGWGKRERGVAKRSEQSRIERAATGTIQQPCGIGKAVAMEWGTMGQPWGNLATRSQENALNSGTALLCLQGWELTVRPPWQRSEYP